jgi:hypothetical protein
LEFLGEFMPVDHAITTLIDVIEEHVNLLTSEAKVKCSEGILEFQIGYGARA